MIEFPLWVIALSLACIANDVRRIYKIMKEKK